MVDTNLVPSWILGAPPRVADLFSPSSSSSMEAAVDSDYEALPLHVSPYTHMCAGALAGIMEHCVMYPVDSVKTRMQSIRLASTYRGAFDGLVKMVTTEGLLRPVRGIQAVFVGAGPAHAMYFACYENVKSTLEARIGHGPLAHGLAGSAAAVFHDAVMNPAEVVKQRMQMFSSPYKSCSQCFGAIWRTEGPRAFYRSYFTQLAMNVPFQGIHFMVYELMQDYMNPTRSYDPKSHVISGAMAGAIAAAVTTPLDVCKTLLNTQELCAFNRETAIRGLPQAMKAIYRCCGFRGYFQGLQARVIFQMPSTAISWSVYEFFKYFITKQQADEHG